MTINPSDDCSLSVEPDDCWRQTDLGTRIDRNGKTTYHVLTSDRRAGVFFEKVFDQDHNLLRIQKRSRSSTSESHFDTASGALKRIFESSTLPDGNSMTKELVYREPYSSNASDESVIVISPNGELVRRVEREHVGSRTVFQGQTEYNLDGTPATTVNHHMDQASGRLLRREQIQWHSEGHRSLAETFHFNMAGALVKYSKVLYHSGAGPFLEEIVVYDSQGQTIAKREIVSYSFEGQRTSRDILTYSYVGEILERKTIFFDGTGKAVATRQSNP
ncbi:MAG TPA: hypothetical protein V6C72_00595 [Chroococcales cyanobacterium]